ncbi:MAG: DUF4386 domain-containing protein [Rhodanobacter sp.]
MANESRIARWAGLTYLLVVAAGFFSLGYVPGKVAAPGNSQAMLANIVSHEGLFRAGIGSLMVEQVVFLLLPLLLFLLLGAVNRAVAVALAMATLVATAVPIALVGVSHRLDALWLLTNPGGLPIESVHAMASLSLITYDHPIFVANLLWGLWLLPFGYLVFDSGMLPRVVGVLLILGGTGYLVDVFADLLFPAHADTPSDYVHLPAALGEIATCLWLLVMGVRSRDERNDSGQVESPA